MRQIDLQVVPNQRFTVSLLDAVWDIEIKDCISHMVASVWRNGEPIILGYRIVARQPFIPYRYLAIYGNFVISGDGDNQPDWRRFGTAQQLYFYEPGELAEISA